MGAITFRVLGAVTATTGTDTVDLGGPRQRAVLARLLVAGGRVVPVDRIVHDMWPDEAPPRAIAGLQAYVSHLRRVLEPERPPRAPATLLVTAPPGYALHAGTADVDAWQFEALVRQPAASAADLDSALALWRGPAYAEMADEPWARAEAERLEELRRVAVERRAEAVLNAGRAAEAAADLRAHVTGFPFREEAWRLLALALYRGGRQADALATLREARLSLVEQLGVDPGPRLRQLEADILAHAPALDGPVAEPVTVQWAQSTVDTDVFVGRDAELRALVEAVHASRIALISGEAGAGKSALADRLGRNLTGWRVAWGRCPESDGAPPAWPWAELLRELAAETPPPADLADALRPLLTDSQSTVDGDVAGGRFRLHRAAGAYLARLSADRPLLVVLDDLHRADAETTRMLADLLPELAGSAAVVVGTYRPTEVTDRLADLLARLAPLEPARVELTGLDRAAVAEIVHAFCPGGTAESIVDIVATRTGGNVFFVRETARLLAAEGESAATVGVPAGVRDVIRRRVGGLPAVVRTVLTEAAVVGRDVDVDVLLGVARVDEETALSAVESALLAGLMTEPDVGRVRFAHALVCDTLYEEVSLLRRARVHARVATALERLRPGDVAALAHHHYSAGTPAAAAHYGRLAAEQAERRFAHQDAVVLWRRAIESFENAHPVPDERGRLELVLRLVRVLMLGGDQERARVERLAAVRAALAVGDPELTARAIASYDVPAPWTNRDYGTTETELIEATDRTLRELASPHDDPLRCRLLTVLALELEGDPDSDRGHAAALEAVEMARRLGDPGLLATALNGRYIQSFRTGCLHERHALGTELLELARAHRLTGMEAVAQVILMQACTGWLRLDDARAHALEVRRLAVEQDLPLLGSLTNWHEGLLRLLAGDFGAASQRYEDAAEELARCGTWPQVAAGMRWLALYGLRLATGRPQDNVEPTAEFYAAWPGGSAEPYAYALAAAGRLDEARILAREYSVLRRDYLWLPLIAVRGMLGVLLDDRQRCDDAYDALLPYAGELAGAATASLTFWPVSLVLGTIAEHRGDRAAAAQHFKTAAELPVPAAWREAAAAGYRRTSDEAGYRRTSGG